MVEVTFPYLSGCQIKYQTVTSQNMVPREFDSTDQMFMHISEYFWHAAIAAF